MISAPEQRGIYLREFFGSFNCFWRETMRLQILVAIANKLIVVL